MSAKDKQKVESEKLFPSFEAVDIEKTIKVKPLTEAQRKKLMIKRSYIVLFLHSFVMFLPILLMVLIPYDFPSLGVYVALIFVAVNIGLSLVVIFARCNNNVFFVMTVMAFTAINVMICLIAGAFDRVFTLMALTIITSTAFLFMLISFCCFPNVYVVTFLALAANAGFSFVFWTQKIAPNGGKPSDTKIEYFVITIICCLIIQGCHIASSIKRANNPNTLDLDYFLQPFILKELCIVVAIIGILLLYVFLFIMWIICKITECCVQTCCSDKDKETVKDKNGKTYWHKQGNIYEDFWGKEYIKKNTSDCLIF